jgi:hypothetical protein
MPMARRHVSRRKRIAAALVGGLLGAGLVGGSASMYHNRIIPHAIIGAAQIGFLCDGVVTGIVSPVTLGAVVCGLFMFMIGPGYDDYMGVLVVPAAILGACAGRRFRKTGATEKAATELHPATLGGHPALQNRP